MPLPSDPYFSLQWHLLNPVAGLRDLNVTGVWDPVTGLGHTGAGTRTVVIDDGFDYRHADLAAHYDTTLDYDFDENDSDPFGDPENGHGTAVSGLIGSGAVGVAPDTQLVGYRTPGFITDAWLVVIHKAIYQAAVTAKADVVNISQGIANDLNSEFGVGYNALRFDQIETSIGTAVDTGRGGLGMTIVKSAGNSRSDNYDVNADDWTNDTRQVVVAAVDQDGHVSSYSSYGDALLVSAFGTPGEVVTTDRTGPAGYQTGNFTYFNGTSAAAPMVSGVVALMYEANSALGWRDVQSILAASAHHVGSAVGDGITGFERYGWDWNGSDTWNGGGMHFSGDYGYGLVDALAAVRLSESWLLTGSAAATSHNQVTGTVDVLNGSVTIPDGNLTGMSFSGTAARDDVIERVTVDVDFATTYAGDIKILLTSPEGTVSRLIDNAGSSNGYDGTWTFETQAFRGEHAAGTWTVQMIDTYNQDAVTVSDIVIRTWGASTTDDRHVFTDGYSGYAGVAGHDTSIRDDNGGTDTVNAAAVRSASTIRLDGLSGSIDGVPVTFRNIGNAIGGDGDDTLIGNETANDLHGMRGNDLLRGLSGNDRLYGGDGNDALFAGGGADHIYGGAGNDRAGGGSGNDFVHGGAGNDRLTGNNNSDLLDGGAGDDVLDGGSVRDTMYGGAGDDLIYGGVGIDRIYGGTGNDIFIYSDVSWSLPGREDTVHGFDSPGRGFGDRFDLSGIDTDTFAAGIQTLSYGGSQGAGALNTGIGYFWFANVGADTHLRVNSDAVLEVDFAVVIADGGVSASAYTGFDVII